MVERTRDDDRGSRRSSRDEPEERSNRSRSNRDDERPARSSRDRDDDDRGSRRSSRDRDDEDRGSRNSSSSSRYEYQARDASASKKRASMGANDFDKLLKDNIKMWKPNDGDNRIRILPPTWPKPEHYGLDIYVHYGVGPDRGSYLCLDKMLGKPDPIAEERKIARDDGDEKYSKELEAKRRVLVYLIDRDHPKEGIQAWSMPWTVDRDIVKVSQDRDSGEVLQIDHPEEGYDVEFEKKGAKDRTEYLGVAIARRSTPLNNDDAMEFAVENPLPDQLVYFPYDHIAKAFGGQGAQKERSRSSRDDEPEERGGRAGGGGRDRDEPPARGRESSRRSEPEEPTWESVHEMTYTELEDLIEQEDLDIKPKEAKDDEDLADWICEEMKLTKKKKVERKRDADDEESTSDKLRDMRRKRGD